MTPITVRRTALPLALALSAPVFAGVSVGTGFDYTVGDYGTGTNTTILTVPLIVKYEEGPLTLKATLPYVRAEGRASGANERRNDDVPANKVSQSGIGDVVGSAFLNVWNSQGGHGLDLGLKVKLATASRRDFLITTGENDFSVQADYFMPLRAVANTTAFFSFGHTLKGDPPGINYRNPRYFTAGISQRVSDTGSWGVAYDYRQKILPGRDALSEASVFYSYRYSKAWKIQAYGVAGVASDVSPDFGFGATAFFAY
jgi:hypothetical protein